MARRKRHAKVEPQSTHSQRPRRFPPEYDEARRLALSSDRAEAREVYSALMNRMDEPVVRCLIENDLGAMSAVDGDLVAARRRFESALAIDPNCSQARANLEFLDDYCGRADRPFVAAQEAPPTSACDGPIKVAVLSFLFNWPSAGGGIMHTVELGRALLQAGYEVRHFFAKYQPWGVGDVAPPKPLPSEVLDFREEDWSRADVVRRYRSALEGYRPDYVLIMDSWNFKPWLAEACRAFPYLLVLQAQETLCPLNNIRFLIGPDGRPQQCTRNQLATAAKCGECLRQNGRLSGPLHRVERELSEVGTAAYECALRESFQKAVAVLVMNPLIAGMVEPFAEQVVVAPAAIDAARFPWPPERCERPAEWGSRKVVFFAGVVSEPIKGFSVVREACARLWKKRRDFLLVATADPAAKVEEFIHYCGWLSQHDLPRALAAADICVVPSIAQESFGRVAAEAMGAGKPVVASRIGGLSFTVTDGATGLLFQPGNVDDLAAKIETLLDDGDLRGRLGREARRRFESELTWDVVLERRLRPLLSRRQSKCH